MLDEIPYAVEEYVDAAAAAAALLGKELHSWVEMLKAPYFGYAGMLDFGTEASSAGHCGPRRPWIHRRRRHHPDLSCH
jgi:hypothetical protein